MASNKTLLLGTTVIAGCFALALTVPSVAFAQGAPQATAPATPVPDSRNQDDAVQDDEREDQRATPDDDATQVEELVVTGSRIRRNEFTSASPIQVITSEQSSLEGLVDTTEILQSSSTAAGSQQINNFFGGFITDGGPGANTISLRGLGAERTLVLLNGRRLNPAGTRGAVQSADLNTIPDSIIDRVEILKDGASSIYGSDAVAGVVNIITKTDLDGIELSIYGNAPFDGGGENFQIQGAYGKTFDRGFFSITADYNKRERLRFGDRDYFACAQDYAFDPATGQRTDIVDPTTGTFKCFNTTSGVIQTLQAIPASRAGGGGNAPTRSYVFDPAAVLGGGAGGCDLAGFRRVGVAFRTGVVPTAGQTLCVAGNSGTTTFPIDVAATRASTSVNPTTDDLRLRDQDVVFGAERATVAGFGNFDLTPGVELYGEFLLNRRETGTNSFQQYFENIPASNPFNPFGNAFLGGPTTGGVIARSIALVSRDQAQKVDFQRYVLGVRGDVPTIGFLDGFNYDLYASYGKSRGEYDAEFGYRDRLLAAVNSTVRAADGTLSCNSNLITVSDGGPNPLVRDGNVQCVPINFFAPLYVTTGQFSAAEEAYLRSREVGTTEYTQKLVEGTVAGNLFALPAGEVGISLGFQYREEELDDQPGFNARNANLYNQGTANITQGSDEVKEVFAEVEVPLLRDVPFFDTLTLQLSGRYSDYESFGNAETYKVGLNWQITPEYRIRATKGTSFRAPTISELFLGNSIGFQAQSVVDPCIAANLSPSPNATILARCLQIGIPSTYVGAGSSSATVISGGGAGFLKAETSDADSVGLIWTPDFIDLEVNIDYFQIIINDQVASFGVNIPALCFTAESFPNSPFCALFQRNSPTAVDQPNAITQINNTFVNIASQNTAGIDLTFRYGREFSFADLTVEGQFTWTNEDFFLLLPDQPTQGIDYNGTIADPDFVGNLNFRLDRGDYTLFYGLDAFSRTSAEEDEPATVQTIRSVSSKLKFHTEPVIYHDISLRRKFDRFTVQGGIQNLFDERPPLVSVGGTQFNRIGMVPLASQYDWLGRRAFIEVNARF